jgi:hypothetical protein
MEEVTEGWVKFRTENVFNLCSSQTSDKGNHHLHETRRARHVSHVNDERFMQSFSEKTWRNVNLEGFGLDGWIFFKFILERERERERESVCV